MMVGAMSGFAQSCRMSLEEVIAAFARDIPLRRVSEPKEMAGICSFLASDDASFVNAAVIPVDGGACVVDVSGAAINHLGTSARG